MTAILLAAVLMAAPAAQAPEKAPFCRGVLLKDEQGTFLLITLKVAGDPSSRARVWKAAEPLGAYFFETSEDGRTILQVGFVSNAAGADVWRLWKNITKGVYGPATVEPFALPGSWIKPNDPCFGSPVGP